MHKIKARNKHTSFSEPALHHQCPPGLCRTTACQRDLSYRLADQVQVREADQRGQRVSLQRRQDIAKRRKDYFRAHTENGAGVQTPDIGHDSCRSQPDAHVCPD